MDAKPINNRSSESLRWPKKENWTVQSGEEMTTEWLLGDFLIFI